MRYEPGISMKFDEQEVFDKIKKEIRWEEKHLDHFRKE
jgi:hypothetical protein